MSIGFTLVLLDLLNQQHPLLIELSTFWSPEWLKWLNYPAWLKWLDNPAGLKWLTIQQ